MTGSETPLFRRFVVGLALATTLAAGLPGQEYGLWPHDGGANGARLCGWLCAPSYMGFAATDSGGRAKSFGVNVIGRRNSTAVLIATAGQPVSCNVGIQFPSIDNVLLARFPPWIVLPPVVLQRVYGGAGCGDGYAAVLATTTIPAQARNSSVSIQAVVTDARTGRLTFTQAVEIWFY